MRKKHLFNVITVYW